MAGMVTACTFLIPFFFHLFPNRLNEATQVAAYGLSTYGQSYWNMVDVASYVGQVREIRKLCMA